MATISLEKLLEIVTSIRTAIALDYGADFNDCLELKDTALETEWVVPLMRYGRDSPPLDTPCAALHFRLYRNENSRWQRGTGSAMLELLARMPKRGDELGLCGEIKPLVTISAGKHTQETARYIHLVPAMPNGNLLHYRSLVPIMMDILNRFAREVKKLPEDLDWREDLSHLRCVA